MRKSIYTLAVILTLFSCKKYEDQPLDMNGVDIYFDPQDKNGDLASQFLNNLYTNLPKPGSVRIGLAVLDAATDDAGSSSLNSTIENMAIGKWTALSNGDDNYADSYAGIRNANLLLAHVDTVPILALTKSYWKAEARFIRAMCYFELIKRYGGVPLIGNRVLTLANNLYPARNSYDSCVSYIAAECDSLKTLLRPDPVADLDLGRVTQASAYALKSRLLLYAASPLNNPTGDMAKWQAAADEAKALMDKKLFSLVADFNNVFVVRKNTEVILSYQRALTTDLEVNFAPIGYLAPNASNGYLSPSQNLVDAFPSANGRAINDIGNNTYNAALPYTNRDPRLAKTVFTNGATWLKRAIQTYEGGMDKPSGTVRQTRTGYYMRKFLADMSASTAYSNQSHNYIIFRYAETLLNYAEAINETGNQAEAFKQLAALRLRAGIPIGTTVGYQYGLKTTMTQTEMRTAVQLERRLELAFEEHRFNDLRRWKLAESVMNNQPLLGTIITKDPVTGLLTYTPSTLLTMFFTAPKMYLEPIPYSEIQKNTNLVQNPGW